MINIKQVAFSELQNRSFDLFVAASGFESRATFQTSQFTGVANRRLVFGFSDRVTSAGRKENDAFFSRREFIFDTVDADLEVFQIVEASLQLEKIEKAEIEIYVDYSCMTRNMYAQILNLAKSISSSKKVSVCFGYSHAKYVKASNQDILNRFVEPILGYCSISVPVKPTAVLICLGNERNRAYGLQEYFDAATYLFYSDSSLGNPFAKEVEDVNKELLLETKPENIFRFPMHDLIYTDYLIENVCKVLSKDFRVIIAPCGPKTFTLLALINSLKLDCGIEVWRISPGKGMSEIDREPNGKISCLEVTF